MMAVRYHKCTCHLRYATINKKSEDSDENAQASSDDTTQEKKEKQPWYYHFAASLILIVQGLTFLAPNDLDGEDTDMVRIVGKWFGFDLEFLKMFTPYAQVKNPFLWIQITSLVYSSNTNYF